MIRAYSISFCLVILLGILIQLEACAQEPTKNRPPDLRDYHLVFQDNFDGNKVDTSYWTYRDSLPINKYVIAGVNTVVSPRKKNNFLKDGKLFILTSLDSNEKELREFTTGGLSTKGKGDTLHYFRYGFFEIRAQLPKNPGDYAAFWLQSLLMGVSLDAPNPSTHGVEVDIFEYGPATPETIYYSLHWNGYAPGKTKTASITDRIPGLKDGFHTFALEWTPEEYIVYVDNKERARSSLAISRQYSYVLLSTGVGDLGGNYFTPGPWPDHFIVDYVKFYRRKPEVRIYEKPEFYGKISQGIPPGNYTASDLKKMNINDAVASVEIPEGWQVTLYELDNFKGKSITILKDNDRLSLPFDKTGSIRITIKSRPKNL